MVNFSYTIYIFRLRNHGIEPGFCLLGIDEFTWASQVKRTWRTGRTIVLIVVGVVGVSS